MVFLLKVRCQDTFANSIIYLGNTPETASVKFVTWSYLTFVHSLVYIDKLSLALAHELITHKERWSKIEGVSIKGFVPNLIAEYKESRVVIVPIYSGTGTSVKLVEAMNLNRVCVSTQEGVRGYDQYLKNIEDYLLAKTDEEFANNILTLVDDVELCNKIATSAKNKIEKYYSQHKFNEIVKKSVIH